MSLWQYQAAVNGYIEANASDDDASLSDDEINALGSWIDAGN